MKQGSAEPHRPKGLPLMRMQWRHLLFMHWPIDANVLRPLIPHPDRLSIDTFDGTAWIGLIPFTMRCVQPWPMPSVPGLSDVPALTAFHECNVRTYVTCDGVPGVWFFSLDAASAAAVWGARTFFHLPYFRARMSLSVTDQEIRYETTRRRDAAALMRCRWSVGSELPRSEPGQLAHFLTERYCLYAADPSGNVQRGWISHRPWPLRSATVHLLEQGLVGAAGIDIDNSQAPVAHCSNRLDVLAWRLRRA